MSAHRLARFKDWQSSSTAVSRPSTSAGSSKAHKHKLERSISVGPLGMSLDLQSTFHVSLHQMVQAIVTVLAVINPVVCGSIFLTLAGRLLPAQKRRTAVRVALSILIILVVSALIGLKVLSIFGISLDVFRIVGGMIIAYMGFDMLSGRQTVAQASPQNDDVAASSSLAPLIMFAAGPGAITPVVRLAGVRTPHGFPVAAIFSSGVGARSYFSGLLSAF